MVIVLPNIILTFNIWIKYLVCPIKPCIVIFNLVLVCKKKNKNNKCLQMYSSLGRLLAVDIAYPCLPYYFPLKSLEGHRKAFQATQLHGPWKVQQTINSCKIYDHKKAWWTLLNLFNYISSEYDSMFSIHLIL